MNWEHVSEILIPPTVSTLLLFLYFTYRKKEKKDMQLYFNMFFSLMLIKLFVFTMRLTAVDVDNNYFQNCEYTNTYNNFERKKFHDFVESIINEEFFHIKDLQFLSTKQTQEYKRKKEYELNEGHRCFNQANKLCLMIPNKTEKEIADNLFAIAITTAAGYALSGYHGVLVALIGDLAFYLQNSIKEYRAMQSLLLEAQSHYDLAAFYQNVLEKG